MRWCAVGEQHHHLAPFFKLISRNAGQHISGFAHAIVRSRGTSSMKFIYSSFDKFSLVFWVSTGNNNLCVVGVRHLRTVTIIMVSFRNISFIRIPSIHCILHDTDSVFHIKMRSIFSNDVHKLADGILQGLHFGELMPFVKHTRPNRGGSVSDLCLGLASGYTRST